MLAVAEVVQVGAAMAEDVSYFLIFYRKFIMNSVHIILMALVTTLAMGSTVYAKGPGNGQGTGARSGAGTGAGTGAQSRGTNSGTGSATSSRTHAQVHTPGTGLTSSTTATTAVN